MILIFKLGQNLFKWTELVFQVFFLIKALGIPKMSSKNQYPLFGTPCKNMNIKYVYYIYLKIILEFYKIYFITINIKVHLCQRLMKYISCKSITIIR